jgi:hypothetical protein
MMNILLIQKADARGAKVLIPWHIGQKAMCSIANVPGQFADGTIIYSEQRYKNSYLPSNQWA